MPQSQQFFIPLMKFVIENLAFFCYFIQATELKNIFIFIPRMKFVIVNLAFFILKFNHALKFAGRFTSNHKKRLFQKQNISSK